MRTAEYGLRSLARHLKVKLKKHPIEYAEWGTLAVSISAKIDSLPSGRGKKKDDDLEFYRGSLSECLFLKDVWRNRVMHTRARYNHSDALGVFLHVKEFMTRLASRVAESNQT